MTIPVQYLLYYPRRRRRQLIANAPPSTSVPPAQNIFISTWLPAGLPWFQYRQILSPQSAPLSLACSFSPTPHFSDADTTHPTQRPSPPEMRSNPDLESALPKSSPYGTLRVQSYPLRCAGIHPGPPPHPPRSPHGPLYQIASTTPCLVHSLLLATPADGCTLQGDIPGLQLLPRRRTPLYFSTLNNAFFAGLSSTSPRGGRLERRRGRPSLTRLPSVAFHLRVLVEMKPRIWCPLLILPTSSMRSKRLSVKSSSTLQHTPLLITRDAQASAAMRAPALVAMETKSTIPLKFVSPLAARWMDCIWRVKNMGDDFDLRYALHHFSEVR